MGRVTIGANVRTRNRLGPTLDTFSPPPSPPPSLGWVESWWAGDLALSNGANVSTWVGRSATYTLTAAGTTPTYAATGLGGKPAVSFVSGRMSVALARSEPYSIVTVFATSNASATQIVAAGATPGDTFYAPAAISGAYYARLRTTGGSSSVSGGSVNTSPHWAAAIGSGSTQTLIVDGTTIGTGNPGGTVTAISTLLIGSASTGASPLAGRIAFVGVYPGNVTSDGNWSAWVAWAESTYGI